MRYTDKLRMDEQNMASCIRQQRIHSRQETLSLFQRYEKNTVSHEKEIGQRLWTKVLVFIVVKKERKWVLFSNTMIYEYL